MADDRGRRLARRFGWYLMGVDLDRSGYRFRFGRRLYYWGSYYRG